VIDLRLIQHALALARFRNYARAARALHLTQPTITRSIAALERAVGVRLFDRGRKGVEPTAFGNILLERGARVLASEADLRREIQLLAGLDVGRLAVIAAHPKLKVRALLADPREVVREVLARRADVGLVDVQFICDETDLVAESMPRHDHRRRGPSSITCEASRPRWSRPKFATVHWRADAYARNIRVGSRWPCWRTDGRTSAGRQDGGLHSTRATELVRQWMHQNQSRAVRVA
jgi:DNA-binding transcriptional LysR family regulator